MSKPKLKAILYDMDGTIVNFQIDYLRARKGAIDVLIKHGIPKNRYTVENSIIESVKDARLYLKNNLAYSDEKIESIMNQVNDAVVEVEMAAAARAIPTPNIYELLDFAHLNQLKQLICTYNTHGAAELTLKTAGLDQYFHGIYGRDDVLKPKPNPNHLQKAIEKFRITPQTSILIGDHSADIHLGINFGCKTIGVKTDHNRGEVADADFIVEPDELAERAIQIITNNYALNSDY